MYIGLAQSVGVLGSLNCIGGEEILLFASLQAILRSLWIPGLRESSSGDILVHFIALTHRLLLWLLTWGRVAKVDAAGCDCCLPGATDTLLKWIESVCAGRFGDMTWTWSYICKRGESDSVELKSSMKSESTKLLDLHTLLSGIVVFFGGGVQLQTGHLRPSFLDSLWKKTNFLVDCCCYNCFYRPQTLFLCQILF